MGGGGLQPPAAARAREHLRERSRLRQGHERTASPVWRAGANDTTRLTTQAPLQLGGKTLPPGVYNVFIELKPGNWTLVLNTQPVQEKYDPNEKVKLYGSYNYDAKFDVMRVPMTVKTSDSSRRAVHDRVRQRDDLHRHAVLRLGQNGRDG